MALCFGYGMTVVLFVKEFLDVFWDTVCVTFNGIGIIAREVLVYVQKYRKKTKFRWIFTYKAFWTILHWKLWQAKLNVWQLTDFCPLILAVLLLFFYLVIYIFCLLLIYFLLCAVYCCCYFGVNKNKFVVTWTRQYFTRRTNLTLTIAFTMALKGWGFSRYFYLFLL